jgi:predicted dehydrogenase
VNARVLHRAALRPRIGFLGLGWIGRQRLEALSDDDAELAAFADIDGDLARCAAGARRGALIGSNLDDLLAADLDGVVIATPSGFHEQQACAALAGGVAVFCQKPLATSGAGAKRVIDAAASADRLLAADFCYREVEGMGALRNLLRAREFGEVVAIDLTFHNAYAPASTWSNDRKLAGGGCLLDLGVHLVDLALWLQDFPALEVESARLFARGVAPAVDAVEDFACATLRQQNGAAVRLACSWNLHAGQGAHIELTLYGTRGAAAWRNVGGSFYDFEISRMHRDQRTPLFRDRGGWAPRALKAWLARLAHDRSFSAEARQLAASAAVIDSIYRAAGRERRP